MKLMATLFCIVAMLGVTTEVAQGYSNNKTQRVEKINKYLANTPMRGIGKILEKEGKKYNVSPYFIVAVSHKESSLGFRSCSNNPRNVWGLGACGRAWNPPYFKNWTQAVNYFVRFVRGKTNVTRGWPNATSPYHFHGYCRGCETSWANSVSSFMNRMGSSSNINY